ncbi:MAG: AmmeMemoRadiSam system radical SAM enzyme [Thermoplasmatales archaeon]|nr:MAG: AmmeMemoRadiSam system radical SAM enzyme [Thermoplasmatales archaeon]
MERNANFWKPIKNKKIQCTLCSHRCSINNGKKGICGVRKNKNGKLYTLIYGSCSSMAADPIEKKPLYHFYPGTSAFSMGTIGCNFKCDHCQNYSISTATTGYSHIRDIDPQQVVELAKEYACQGIAWTYNEPTIWHEFSFDSSRLAKKAKLYTIYVSNGYISEDPLREISPYLDAINVDVKAFNEDFYKKICNAHLQPVLDTCELTKELDIHLELTYLVIPGYNDSIKDIENFCNWIIEKLGNDTPVHFSRFHPDYKLLTVKMTPIETLLKIYDFAKDCGILYPYLGNVPPGKYENTICYNCGNICIQRHNYSIDLKGVKDGKCTKCNTLLPITIDKYKI